MVLRNKRTKKSKTNFGYYKK